MNTMYVARISTSTELLYGFSIDEVDVDLNDDGEHTIVNSGMLTEFGFFSIVAAELAARSVIEDLNKKAVDEAAQWLAENTGT